MKRTRKSRWLLIAGFVLFSVMALNLPSRSANATGFCEDCASDCYTETWGMGPESYYNTCRDNGGSVEACTESSKNNYNSCAMICNFQGCNIPYAQ